MIETYEVSKKRAVQQARFLSGRYRTENLAKHWSNNNAGFCTSSTCLNEVETTEHILIHCRAYAANKKNLYALWLDRGRKNKVIFKLVIEALTKETPYFLQFILDCSVLPSVITARQTHGEGILEELFYLTRTWCFTIHRQRMKRLGRWNFQ